MFEWKKGSNESFFKTLFSFRILNQWVFRAEKGFEYVLHIEGERGSQSERRLMKRTVGINGVNG